MARIGIVATARRCRCSPPPPPRKLLLFLLVALATKAAAGSFSSSSSSATTDPRPTDFIDCNDPCNGGDANYELIASVQTIPMAFGNHTYRGRTFARPDPKTGRVPYGKHTGPTITAKPGQTLWIKFRNELGERTTPTETTTDTATDTTKPPSREGEEEEVQLLPKNVAVEDYWVRLKKPGEKIKYRYYKPPVASPDLMEVDWSNIPSGYDSTNLHLHGLDVEVHMFDPVGTHNPEAPHVKIGPGKCYCYRFRIPEDHPDGLYWYHPHVHGSSAVQLWGGMMGLVKIEGTFVEELRTRHGVTDSRDFVIWDPAFQDVRDLKPGATHDIEVDEFLNGQTTLSKIHPFLVNGEITPLFDNVVAGEVLHLRVLCGTIENENTFIVYKEPEGEQQQRPTDYSTWDWKESGLPFWVVASDGVAYDRARKRTAIVLAGGQREELLLRFDEPGTYVVSQQGIQGMQFFGMYGHPHDQLLAKIRVVEKATDEDEPERGRDHEDESRAGGGALEEAEEAGSTTTTAKREKQRQSRLRLQKYTDETMDAMEFTPGYGPEETIRAESITKTESIVFSMGANRNMAPFPQYYINGKAFRQDRLDFHANPGDAVEYVLINGNHNVHPVSVWCRSVVCVSCCVVVFALVCCVGVLR